MTVESRVSNVEGEALRVPCTSPRHLSLDSSLGRCVCLGIDVQDDGPIVVRGKRVRGHITLKECPADVARNADAPCAAALFVREGFARWVQSPFPSFRKTRRVLPTLLDIQLPFPMESCRYSVSEIERAEDGNARALAVVARTADMDRRLSACREAGVDPVILDYEGLALWTQSLRERPPSPDDPAVRIVVALHRDRASLAIGRGTRYLGAHAVPGGDAAGITRLVRAQTGVESERVLWIWTGPGAEHADTVARLRDALSVEWAGPSTTPERPRAFLARALATRALLNGPWPCNLRAGDCMHAETAREERRAARSAAALVFAAGLILIGASWSARLVGARRESTFDRDCQYLVNTLAGYPVNARRGDAVRVARDEAAARIEQRRPFVAVFDASLLDVVTAVAETAGKRQLSIHDLSLTRAAATIQGTSAAWEGGEALKRRLETAGYSVALRRDEALADERIPFTVSTDETAE